MAVFTGTIIGISISSIASLFFFLWLYRIRNNKLDVAYLNNAASDARDFIRKE
jgi:hypothetical protein